ncbi:MAG: hypothetical protein ABJG68_15315 [Crocinitomicaceae bacterium]
MFKKKSPKTCNYLKLYLNIGKDEYSEKEKEQLVNSFIPTLEEIFPSINLKYDIGGHGYGISKGDGYFGIKALRSKFEKKGYDNMYSVTCSALENKIQAGMLFLPARKSNFISFHIVAPFEQCVNEKLIETVLRNYNQICSVDYGYGYEVGKGFVGSVENYEKKGLFSTSLSVNPDQFEFENKLESALAGKIKKIYELNVFNKQQSELLYSTGLDNFKSIDDVDYLILNPQDLSKVEAKVRNQYI